MYISFDKELKKLVKRVSKFVAKALDVEVVDLVIITYDNKIELCFGCSEDDTYADLVIDDLDGLRLYEVMKNFINDDRVEWLNRNGDMKIKLKKVRRKYARQL